MVYFFVHDKSTIPLAGIQWRRWVRPLRKLDWFGSALCISTVVVFFLPLEWGGVTMPWRSPTIIALFCMFGVLSAVFVWWEWRRGQKALLPLFMLMRRTQTGAALLSVSPLQREC